MNCLEYFTYPFKRLFKWRESPKVLKVLKAAFESGFGFVLWILIIVPVTTYGLVELGYTLGAREDVPGLESYIGAFFSNILLHIFLIVIISFIMLFVHITKDFLRRLK